MGEISFPARGCEAKSTNVASLQHERQQRVTSLTFLGSVGRKPIHGRYSKAAIASRRQVRAILRTVRELIN
jgi:hypothetical protein